MADAYLKQYANILLEDAISKLLTETGDIFVTDGSSPLITDRFLMEDGLGIYLLEGGTPPSGPPQRTLMGVGA